MAQSTVSAESHRRLVQRNDSASERGCLKLRHAQVNITIQIYYHAPWCRAPAPVKCSKRPSLRVHHTEPARHMHVIQLGMPQGVFSSTRENAATARGRQLVSRLPQVIVCAASPANTGHALVRAATV